MWKWRAGKNTDRNPQGAASDEHSTGPDKTVISGIIGIRAAIDRAWSKQREHERAKAKRDYATIAALVVASGVAAWGIIQSHSDTRKALGDARASSTQQHADTLTALDKTDATVAALQAQAQAMRGQLDAMQADQRAWVKVVKAEPSVDQLIPRNGLYFAGPDKVGFLPLHFVLRNVGRSPAFKVIVGVWPQFGPAPSDLTKEEQKNCAAMGDVYPDTAVRAMNSDIIPVLFPEDPTPYDGRPLVISPEQVTQFSTGDPKTYNFWFYGCVYYRLAGSKAAHQSGFAYWVTRLVDAPIPGLKAQTSFLPWENVPADRLQFNPMPLAAGPTN
jgi:hypothetical protein